MAEDNYRYQGEEYYPSEMDDSFDGDDYNFGARYAGARRALQYSTVGTNGVPTNAQTFDDYKPQEPGPIDIKNLSLPAPNFSCYVEPPAAKGTITYLRHEEPTITRTVVLNFNTSKTVVRENVVHHQHTKTVITNVIRNHWHTQRIVVKDNNYHHYLINNVIRIKDQHHQKIEQVRGEGKSFNDFKQTQRVEAAQCEYSDRDNKSSQFGLTEGGNGNSGAKSVEFSKNEFGAIGEESFQETLAGLAAGGNKNTGGRASREMQILQSTY